MPKRDTCTCQTRLKYGVHEIVGLFCRIWSLLQGFFAKDPHVHVKRDSNMGWLQLVGSLK